MTGSLSRNSSSFSQESHYAKNARKHASEQGCGEPKTGNEIFRCRLNMEKVSDFIEFFSRSTFLQDVAFGTKTLKLSSGDRIPIPSVVRTMTASKIIYLYHEECLEHGVEPLRERTCFHLLEVCSASKQKSLQGLDNMSTTGEMAFETIASIVENLGRRGVGPTWTRDTQRPLKCPCDQKINSYFSLDFKTMLTKH